MNGVATAKAEREEFFSLKRELARLGSEITKAKERLASYTVDDAAHKRILASLPKLRQREAKLQQSIGRLESAATIARNAADRAERDRKDAQAAYEGATGLAAGMNAKHGIVKRRVEVLSNDAETLAANTRERTRQEMTATDTSLVAARTELAGVQAKIATAKKQFAGMSKLRLQLGKLIASIASKEKQNEALDGEISLKGRVIKAKTHEIDALDMHLEAKRVRHDEMCNRRLAELDAREKDLVNREGTVNRYKGWITSRAGLLAQAKRELEEFRGKVLAHIVIPDVSDLQ